MPDSRAGHVSNVAIKELLYPGWSGKVLCEYQPWFGASNHKSIGYSENSALTVAAHDSFMLAVGCDVNLIDFYGALDPNQSFNLATTNAVFSDLSTRAGYPLKFGIMEDKNAIYSTCPPSTLTESQTVTCLENALMAEMDYINSHYANSPVYLTDAGSPLIFSFVSPEVWPLLTATDWTAIWSTLKAHTDSYTAPFKYLFQFGSFTTAPYDNGRYGWPQPAKYTSTQQFWWGSVTSLLPTYLDTFYSAAVQHPSQLAIGGLWKGFDDNNASWSGNRIIAEQYGKVLLDTANKIAQYYGGTKPQLPYVQIATWNDYEEGTEVETGIDNCYSVDASISGSQLTWSLAASDSYASPATVHHFAIYYADSAGNLYTAADNIAATARTLDLSPLVPAGTWSIYIEMVGQPLIINRMSNAVAFNNTTAVAQLSPTSYSFTTQTVGTSSTPGNITLANSGSASMSVYGIGVTGPFTQTNNCPASLPAGGGCTVKVVFTPTTAGTQTGSLSIRDSAGSVAQVSSLSGVGVLPAISFAPSGLTFTAQALHTTSSTQTVTITNTGPGLLIFSGVSASGAFAVSANSCSGAIAASGSCSFSVSFSPLAGGTQNGSITLSSNAPGNNALPLTGSGADFGISAAPPTQSVAAGNAAGYTISVPSSGASFSNAINLSCSGIPADAVCNFTPNSLNADGAAKLTITTKSAQSAAVQQNPAQVLYARLLRSSGFALLGLVLAPGAMRRKPRTRGLSVFGLILVLGFAFGCGGRSISKPPTQTIAGTPSGTYNVIVSGSSGALTHSTTLTLTVN